MVGLNPRRRFAPKRSLHQEQRLLRFAKTEGGPAGEPTVPPGTLEGLMHHPGGKVEHVNPMAGGERNDMMRLMAGAGGHGAEAGGAGHGAEADGHGGGGGHEGGGEHGHDDANGMIHAIDHKEHELHDLLHKFDDPKMKEALSYDDQRYWATERGFVTSAMEILPTMKEDLAVLAKWQAGELAPEEFMAWLASSKPHTAMTREQQLEGVNQTYNTFVQKAELETATLQSQIDGGVLDSYDRRRALARIAEIKRQEAKERKRRNEQIQKIEKGTDPLLVSDSNDPVLQPGGADYDVFETARADAIADLGSLIRDWPTHNQSDRIVLASTAMGLPAVAHFIAQKLQRAKNVLGLIDQKLGSGEGGRGTQAMVDEIEKRVGATDASGGEKAYDPHLDKSGAGGGSVLTKMKGALGAMGIKFYSIKGLMEGTHLWWEAWKGAMHKYHHREGSMFANFLGKTSAHVPFGDEVEIELEANQDKADDEVKDTYLELLKKRNVNFRALVDGTESELSRNISDYNRTRAVLEYAASRGWLYDLDQGSQNYFFGRHIHDLVPHEWDHTRVSNYISKLTTEQNSGKKAEQEKYKQRYHNVNSTDMFVKLMQEELSQVNMWGAIGILERSIERGLWGEVAPWHTVALIREIQKNPLFRRYVTIDFIDQFGNKTLYNSFGRWSGNVTKLTRKPWFKAIQESVKSGKNLDLKNVIDPDTNKTAQGVDVFLRAEQELEALYGPYNSLSADGKKKFDRQMARFMSGAIVEENGHRTNIFTGKFKDWTDKDVGQGQMKIDGEDEDYYRNGTSGDPSETTTLADGTVFEQIFAVTGNGQFDNESRARFAIDSIVTMIEKFKEKGMIEQRDEYVRITRRKLTKWFQRFSSDARFSAAAFQGMIRPHHNSGERTPYVILEMVRNGLVPLKVLKDGLSQSGQAACVTLLAQCNVYSNKFSPELQAELRTIMASTTPENVKKIREAESAVRSGNFETPKPKQEKQGH